MARGVLIMKIHRFLRFLERPDSKVHRIQRETNVERDSKVFRVCGCENRRDFEKTRDEAKRVQIEGEECEQTKRNSENVGR